MNWKQRPLVCFAVPIAQQALSSAAYDYLKHAALALPRRATELIGIWRVITDKERNKSHMSITFIQHSFKRHSPFCQAGFLWNAAIVKHAIHYSQTWRIRDKIIFSQNKILLAKTRRKCCCTLFVVRRQFSCGRQFFFDEKILCVRRWDCYPTQILHTAYGEKLVRETWRTPWHYSPYVISPLFCYCLRIVYSGLNALWWMPASNTGWIQRPILPTYSVN